MIANFNTITGRFLGFTKEQWQKKLKESGLTEQQMIDITLVESKSNEHDQASKRFFRSGKLGTPTN